MITLSFWDEKDIKCIFKQLQVYINCLSPSVIMWGNVEGYLGMWKIFWAHWYVYSWDELQHKPCIPCIVPSFDFIKKVLLFSKYQHIYNVPVLARSNCDNQEFQEWGIFDAVINFLLCWLAQISSRYEQLHCLL